MIGSDQANLQPKDLDDDWAYVVLRATWRLLQARRHLVQPAGGVHVLDVAWREPTRRCPTVLRLLVEHPDYEVTVAWRRYQQLRPAYNGKNLNEGHTIAVKIVDTFQTCPIPEIARLGRTLPAWYAQFLAYVTTLRATAVEPKPSTASSNSITGSPAASAISTTTGSE